MTKRSEFHRFLLDEHFPQPHVFAVVSWGCAATNWIAKVLNSHPEIFCVHAGNFFWQTFGNAPSVDGVEYLEIIALQGSASIATGDVHGVSRDSIADLQHHFGDNFRAAIVIREPIPRLLSQLALFDKFAKFRTWDIGHIDQVIRELELELPNESYETKLFVHGVTMLNAITEECEIAEVYRSEDLTSNATHLTGFASNLVGAKVELTHEWAEVCIRMRKVNSHRGQTSKTRSLQDWQLKVINKVVLPESWRLYEEYGYQTPEFVTAKGSSNYQSAAA